MRRSNLLPGVLVIALILGAGAYAQETPSREPETKTPAVETTTTDTGQTAAVTEFDPRIDCWSRGEITSLNLEKNTFTIRGMELPFATASAKMFSEIHHATSAITDPVQKKARSDEIRQAWKERLDTAASQTPDKVVEVSLSSPSSGKLMVLSEASIAGVDFLHRDRDVAGAGMGSAVGAPVVPAKPSTGVSTGKELSLSDLKVGDRVLVGYESGYLYNDGHTVIKLSSATPPAETTPMPATESAPVTPKPGSESTPSGPKE